MLNKQKTLFDQEFDNNSGGINSINGNNNIINIESRSFENFEKQDVLSIAIRYIIKENNSFQDFSKEINISIDSEDKIKINNINRSLAEKIRIGIDKQYLINELVSEINIDIETLRDKIIKIYKRYYKKSKNMNEIISKLYNDIYHSFEKKSYDLEIASFIVISYFFEICDVGDNPNDNAK